MFTIGIICGGPSEERGISLNSARTLQDHLNTQYMKTKVFFVDQNRQFFLIDSANLYSNTPSDFDFKIQHIAQAIPQSQLQVILKTCSIIFPVIHGPFGEDGELQKMLEDFQVPFVGSQSRACQQAYLKNHAQNTLKDNHFATLPYLNINQETQARCITQFWDRHCADGAIIKPANAGSSIGVHKICNTNELQGAVTRSLNEFKEVQLQPYCTLQEVTIIVMCNDKQEPVALLPSEAVMQSDEADIFDYRSKYLPTNACRLYTPANLSQDQLTQCRKTAEQIFTLFNLSDFARLDGWICPEQGFICYDINMVSGFEENSFLFKQSSLCGLNHEETVLKILKSACIRQKIMTPTPTITDQQAKKPIFVIFGGASSERQVSLMSGRNVWFKLGSVKSLDARPFFMDTKQRIWELPYTLFLHHTVEEIMDDITSYTDKAVHIDSFLKEISGKLSIPDPAITNPRSMGLLEWVQKVKSEKGSVLLALHGGIGENGTIQEILDNEQIAYNGSSSTASRLCMDKSAAIAKVASIQNPDILSQQQTLLTMSQLQACLDSETACKETWEAISRINPDNKIMIIKPRSDGCSSGIVCLQCSDDLKKYAHIISSKQRTAQANTFYHQPSPIELPAKCDSFLVEPYIETDEINVVNASLKHQNKHGWVELTIVVYEKNSQYHALNPSVTVSANAVLSVEEKFQGGTGINLTPPPESLINLKQRNHIKELSCLIAQTLGIGQYVRLDIFYNIDTCKLQLIEANSLPALTPSTVLFQQALAENPPIYPKDFLKKLVEESTYHVDKASVN